MNANGVLIGQVLMVLAIIAGGMWYATQWTAAELGYQMRLGSPWMVVHGFPIYYPWRLFQWWYAFEAYAPGLFLRAGGKFALSGVLAAVAAIVASVWRGRQSRTVTTYGSARWAEKREIKGTGLLSSSGLFVGRFENQNLRHDGPEHVLVFAPTRSGKGAGIVVPSLLASSVNASVIVHDIKGENWQLTAGWRSKFSHCLYFNPTDPRSAHYNPLLEIRKGIHEVRDTQNIADILVDPEGSLERRSHWDKTSHSLLVGGILHVLYAERDKTLPGVANFFSNPKQTIEQTLHQMMQTKHLDGRPHPVVASAARELLNKSENERSGVLSTAMSFLGLYRDPVVAEVTSTCDWRIDDLVSSRYPITLYLVIPPSDTSRTKPLIRLMLNQIGRRLTESLTVGDGASSRRRVRFFLDEFPALGRLDFFEGALAYMAGYGLGGSLLIAQSLNQVEKAYGVNNSIVDNCHVRVCFSTNDERTAKRISDALGTATELRNQRNYAGHRLSPWLDHLMISRQETARPLLTPGEIMQLPPADEIVMVSGHPPIRAKKIRYFEESFFKSRVLPPPALSSIGGYRDRPPQRADDWTGLSAPPPVPILAPSAGLLGADAGGGILNEVTPNEPLEYAFDPVRELTPSKEPIHGDLPDLDEDDSSPELEHEVQRQLSRTARLAALDQADGIEL